MHAWRPLVLASSLVLAGCGGPQVYGMYYNSGYAPSHPMLAASDGEALAIIRANPFPDDRDNAKVLAAMQARNPGPKVFFRQTSRVEARYDYKVIMTFASSGVGVTNPCLDTQPLPAAARAERTDLRADFCIGNSWLSETRGSVQGVERADDPRLNRLIGDMIAQLMTDRDPNDNNDVCRIPGC
jgi:hypothetical protein